MTDAGPAEQAAPTPYYVVFDVDVRDAPRYMEYMAQVLPQIEAAGGKYLARGGPHTVYEGDWSPYRLVLVEFPSREASDLRKRVSLTWPDLVFSASQTLRKVFNSSRILACRQR
jgi:uncharacterized protein (DUF1330 family)